MNLSLPQKKNQQQGGGEREEEGSCLVEFSRSRTVASSSSSSSTSATPRSNNSVLIRIYAAAAGEQLKHKTRGGGRSCHDGELLSPPRNFISNRRRFLPPRLDRAEVQWRHLRHLALHGRRRPALINTSSATAARH